jgi:hypothetical protein
VSVGRRQEATLFAVDNILEGLPFCFLEQNRDQGRAVDGDDSASRLSMMSRGERGSRIGMAASPATNRFGARGDGFGGLIARSLRFDGNSGGARFLFEHRDVVLTFIGGRRTATHLPESTHVPELTHALV